MENEALLNLLKNGAIIIRKLEWFIEDEVCPSCGYSKYDNYHAEDCDIRYFLSMIDAMELLGFL